MQTRHCGWIRNGVVTWVMCCGQFGCKAVVKTCRQEGRGLSALACVKAGGEEPREEIITSISGWGGAALGVRLDVGGNSASGSTKDGTCWFRFEPCGFSFWGVGKGIQSATSRHRGRLCLD